MFKINVSLLLLLSLAPATAFATHECGNDKLGTTSFRWCIDAPERSSGEILWYFHPVFESEQTWNELQANKDIRADWEKRGLAQPVGISISMGSFWLMTLENQVYPDFVKLILPFLEAKAGGLHGRRLLLGFSMGGFNASQLLLRNGELFERAAFLSPAFLGVGPYSPQSDVDNYFERNNIGFAGRFKVNEFLRLLRENFKTEESWISHNPLELIKGGLPADTKLYVSAADEDNYGFHEGAEAFAREATSRGAVIQWESLQGGHRTVSPEAVARFLLP